MWHDKNTQENQSLDQVYNPTNAITCHEDMLFQGSTSCHVKSWYLQREERTALLQNWLRYTERKAMWRVKAESYYRQSEKL